SMKEHLNDQEIHRREKLNELRAMGVEPYPYSFANTHSSTDILEQFQDDDTAAFADIAIAGRIMAIRRMGKAAFVHIQDAKGRIQVYLRKDDLTNYDEFQLYDIGDII